MAARTRKIFHDSETRARIKASQLINSLSNHVFGKNEMVPSQVTAGLGLLRKVLPDLSNTEVTGKDGKDLIPEATDEQRAKALAVFLAKSQGKT